MIRIPYPWSKLWSKLWLAFFVTLVIGLGAMLLLTQTSVKTHFLNYATSQILERLAPLSDAVVDTYTNHQSLSLFIENPQKWISLRDTTYRQYLRDQKSRKPFYSSPDVINWGGKGKNKQMEANQRIFFHHLTLHAPDKSLVAGQQLADYHYALQAVISDEETIAYIGYIKPKAFLNPADQVFVDQQLRSFTIISGVMVFASLIIAGVIARWLASPLSQLSVNAKKVTAGDFSTRTPIKRNDEVGELCASFNEMATTLEKNEAQRKQWVADISHELRTPLSVLKAQIEAMEDGIREANPSNLKLLRKNVDALNLLVNDLYDLSLADMGALTYHKVEANLNKILQETCEDFIPKAENKSLNLRYTNDNQTSPLIANIDKTRFRQLLRNLLENSLRYTDSPGDIQVSIHKQDEMAIIAIEDSPPSIPQDSIEKIFDRLYRVESSRSRNEGGAGLGLSICKNIVDAHHGEIFAEPSTLGGVSIKITLPCRDSLEGETL